MTDLLILPRSVKELRFPYPILSSKTADIDAKISEALTLEKQSRLKDAIALLQPVKTIAPVKSSIKQRLASEIFDRARRKFNHGEVELALSIADKIPPNSPAWKDYQKNQATWTIDRNTLDRQFRSHLALIMLHITKIRKETKKAPN